jgi:hypothetical protein
VLNERAETVTGAQVIAPDEHISRGTWSIPQTPLAPQHVHRQFALPPWPTSQSGPHVTAPSSGQRLVHLRTDQVMYDCYDQQRGLPGSLPPIPADQKRERQQ